MAIIKDQNEQDQEQGQVGSQASSTVSTGGTGSPATSVAPQAKGSGQFVNLQRYMGANQGNQAVDNSVNMIGQKGTDAANNYNTARKGFDDLKVDHVGDLNQSDQDTLATGKIGSYSVGTDGRASNATMDRLGNSLAGMQYKGPSANDVTNSYNNVNKAGAGLGEASRMFEANPNGAANRQQVLTNEYTKNSNGNYGSGMGRLDSALVENIGRPAFDAQRSALQQLSGGYNDQADAARSQALSAQATQAQDLSNRVQNTYAPQFEKIQSTMQQGVNAWHPGIGGTNSANAKRTNWWDQKDVSAPRQAAAPVAAPQPASDNSTYNDRNKDRLK